MRPGTVAFMVVLLAMLALGQSAHARPYLLQEVASASGSRALDCTALPGSPEQEIEIQAPADGWDGQPRAVVVTNVLNGRVQISHGQRAVCGTVQDARTLDSRFRVGVGTVLVPMLGDTSPIRVRLPEALPPLLPPLIQHGSPEILQLADTGRFVLRVACFAVIMAMALAALLAFFGVGEPVFLVFSVTVVAFGLWLALLAGLWGYPEPWLPLGGLEPRLLTALPLAISGGTARLILKQSGLDRTWPRLDQAAALFMMVMLVVGAAVLLLPGAALPALSVATELLFMAICCAAIVVMAWTLVRGHMRSLQPLASVLPFPVIGLAQLLIPGWTLAWKVELLMLAGAWFVLISSLLLTSRLWRLRRQRDEARVLSETDALTGLANRRSMVTALNSMIRHAQVAGAPLALAFIDVDHFKSINDRLGHAGGDRALVAVAHAIRDSVRNSDRVARLGGEEFLVALPGASPTQAVELLQRLSTRLLDIGPGIGLPGAAITSSIGLTWLGTPPDGIGDLMARADAAMFAAKRAGRDRIELAPPPASSSPTIHMRQLPGHDHG